MKRKMPKMNKTEENDTTITKKVTSKKYAQRFLEKWLTIFDPWITRSSDDPNKAFCRACQIRLDSNRCHLQRHEHTSKHIRNFKILLSKGESAVRENFCVRQERSKYYHQKIKPDIDEDANMEATEEYTDDGDSLDLVQEENAHVVEHDEVPIKTNNSPDKKERLKLLLQIQKDKNDLMDSFKELIANNNSNLVQSPRKERNHIDLFFESVSSSVKALTPKLIAEAKMRVSQLICELELRALTEPEVQNRNTSNVPGVVSSDSMGSFILSQQN